MCTMELIFNDTISEPYVENAQILLAVFWLLLFWNDVGSVLKA